jgi:hypothetical protein
MPIDTDGVITPDYPKYLTRFVVEFIHPAESEAYAQETHDQILDDLTRGVYVMDELLALSGIQCRIRTAQSKTPTAVPEGEGQDGGSSSEA